MYELIQVSENSYYIDCPSKIGLVRIGENEVIAIDSGSDKDAGKKVLRTIQANGWQLKSIFNTHSHADHIGGNKYLQDQTKCRIFAPGIECDFTNHPILEPTFLYGGYPMKELRHKFLMAQESQAERLTENALPDGIKLLSLPGHSYDMVGFRTVDDVVYLADCLSAKETLDKYGIGYLWDVEAYLNTLEQVKQMKAKCFVPAHAPATDEIAELAQYNMDAVRAAGERIVSFCEEPLCFEDLLQKVFDVYELRMNAQQYVLLGSTVRSYLTWLQNQGVVESFFEDNRMLWRQKQSLI